MHIGLGQMGDLPTAKAIPPGIKACQRFPSPTIRATVIATNNAAPPVAHSRAIGGKPLPVTKRAVKIQT
jgi:hypothetical protein